jgi:hypothetical protein
MNHPTDRHHPYPSSSSQDVYHHHRPNPTHTQVMIGHNHPLAASSARTIEYPSEPHISCGAGVFAGRTIRAEVTEIQKANVGRKCVFYATLSRLLHFAQLATKHHATPL